MLHPRRGGPGARGHGFWSSRPRRGRTGWSTKACASGTCPRFSSAAAMRGGVEPDLLNDAGCWQTRLWTYAVCALLIYARAAAERNETTVE